MTDLYPRPHYVYRLFGDDGTLLYIGHTDDPAHRVYHHLSMARLGSGITGGLMYRLAAVTLWRYPSKSEAFAAEKAAITAEAPLLNKHHNLGRYQELEACPDGVAARDLHGLYMRSQDVMNSLVIERDYDAETAA